MNNNEIEDYISSNKKLGYTREAITKILLESGVKLEDIDRSWKNLEVNKNISNNEQYKSVSSKINDSSSSKTKIIIFSLVIFFIILGLIGYFFINFFTSQMENFSYSSDCNYYVNQGQYYKALEFCEATVNNSNRFNLDENKNRLILSRVYFQIGRYEDATNQITIIINNTENETLNKDNFYTRGFIKYKNKDYIGAVEDYLLQSEMKPKDDITYYYDNDGTVSSNQNKVFLPGEYQKGVEKYTDLIQSDSNNASLYRYRAFFHYLKKEYNLGLTDINKAIELKPNYAYYYLISSTYYDLIGETNLSLQMKLKSIELEPNNAKYNYDLAILYQDLDDYNNSLKYYNKAIELKPESKVYYYMRGNLEFKFNNYEKAIENFDRATKTSNGQYVPEYYYMIGLSYKYLKDQENTKKYFEFAVYLAPENKKYVEALDNFNVYNSQYDSEINCLTNDYKCVLEKAKLDKNVSYCNKLIGSNLGSETCSNNYWFDKITTSSFSKNLLKQSKINCEEDLSEFKVNIDNLNNLKRVFFIKEKIYVIYFKENVGLVFSEVVGDNLNDLFTFPKFDNFISNYYLKDNDNIIFVEENYHSGIAELIYYNFNIKDLSFNKIKSDTGKLGYTREYYLYDNKQYALRQSYAEPGTGISIVDLSNSSVLQHYYLSYDLDKIDLISAQFDKNLIFAVSFESLYLINQTDRSLVKIGGHDFYGTLTDFNYDGEIFYLYNKWDSLLEKIECK